MENNYLFLEILLKMLANVSEDHFAAVLGHKHNRIFAGCIPTEPRR
jgi:hypothetical protein